MPKFTIADLPAVLETAAPAGRWNGLPAPRATVSELSLFCLAINKAAVEAGIHGAVCWSVATRTRRSGTEVVLRTQAACSVEDEVVLIVEDGVVTLDGLVWQEVENG